VHQRLKKTDYFGKHNTMDAVLSGAFGGFVQSFLSCPVENVKARSGHYGEGFMQCLKRSIQNDYRGLYRHFPTMAIGDTIGFGLFFGVYSIMKSYLTPIEKKKYGTKGFSIFLSGGVAGIFYRLVNFPIEVVSHAAIRQSELEGKKISFLEMYQMKMKQEGVNMFLKEFKWKRMLKTFSLFSFVFLAYEVVLKSM